MGRDAKGLSLVATFLQLLFPPRFNFVLKTFWIGNIEGLEILIEVNQQTIKANHFSLSENFRK